ncbi:hypothetical protein OESDEN_09573 [Oesophagostomum dentatum]|uniref:Uncharacterized protein n=1 Tax=Oesophagostomum dentatum TaxID=61180 RepID=A0A0B1T368_OESDE|nr:hypothetical protein OESDEN_09573 [Oesophagostomum dentatum]
MGPPRFLQALPPEYRAQIEAIHQNSALTREQRWEQIHQIMESLPESVRANLPKPPGWERLPQATKDELRMIRNDKTLTREQRRERIRAVFEKLPPELRPPRPPHRGPPSERF